MRCEVGFQYTYVERVFQHSGKSAVISRGVNDIFEQMGLRSHVKHAWLALDDLIKIRNRRLVEVFDFSVLASQSPQIAASASGAKNISKIESA